MPSNLATLAPSGRVMAAVPPNLAAMLKPGGVNRTWVTKLFWSPTRPSLTCVRAALMGVASVGRRRDQGRCGNGDNSAH
jgi:hypothetical protein